MSFFVCDKSFTLLAEISSDERFCVYSFILSTVSLFKQTGQRQSDSGFISKIEGN